MKQQVNLYILLLLLKFLHKKIIILVLKLIIKNDKDI